MRKIFFIIWLAFMGVINFSPLSYAQELKDVKPPVDYPSSLGWFLVFLGVGILVIALAALGMYFMRRRKEAESQKEEIVLLAWEKAFALLEKLDKQDLLSQGKIKEYFLCLSDILRHYFEEELNLNAPDRTTEEFLEMLKVSSKMNNSQKNILKEFLVCCDMVKFAKFNPGFDHAKQSMEIVKRLINETKKTFRPDMQS